MEKQILNIAVIGLGEVGRCYAAPLHATGFALSLCEARPSAAANALANELGLVIHDGAGSWLAEVDWVLSCVTGTVALGVVKELASHLKKGATIADLTTASPSVKRAAADAAASFGVGYVDTAIMGGISLNRVRTPLLASGDRALELKQIIEHAGGRMSVIANGVAGDAISLKILRSVFTKGLEALSVELLMSAEKQGVREKLYEQLSDIDQTPLRLFLDMLVRTHVIHAKRRAHEVHDARAELNAQGLSSTVLPGAEDRFRRTAEALEAHPVPVPEPSIEQALDWLLTTAT